MALMDVETAAGLPTEASTKPRRPIAKLTEARSQPRPLGPPAAGLPSALRVVAEETGASTRAVDATFELVRESIGTPAHVAGINAEIVVTGVKTAALTCPVLVVSTAGPDPLRAFAVIAEPLILTIYTGGQQQLRWTLLGGGPTVTARADALRMLRAMAAGGRFSVRFEGGQSTAELDLPGETIDFEDEWALFEDLATLEEWSGKRIPVPKSVTGDEATRVANAAHWVRTRKVPVSFAGPLSVQAQPDAADANELRLRQTFAIKLFGLDVPLGEGRVRLAVSRVEQDGEGWKMWPADPSAQFWLHPPKSRLVRGGRRTQGAGVLKSEGVAASISDLPLVAEASRTLGEALQLLGTRPRASESAEQVVGALRGS